MLKNKKGQTFEAYQLLIAFIVALAILGIIFSMIEKTKSNSIIISTQKIDDAFLSAINSPIISMEKPFAVENVIITGVISDAKYENLGALEQNCFNFIPGPGISLESYGAEIKKKYLETDIYFVCGLENINQNDLSENAKKTYEEISVNNYNMQADCELYCVMYINKTPAGLKN